MKPSWMLFVRYPSRVAGSRRVRRAQRVAPDNSVWLAALDTPYLCNVIPLNHGRPRAAILQPEQPLESLHQTVRRPFAGFVAKGFQRRM